MLAILKPEDYKDILVYRGPAAEDNGKVVVQGKELWRQEHCKRGYGLVKVIYLHGEKGNKRPENPPITREDVRSLPYLVREWDLAEEKKKSASRVWRIPREEDKYLAVAVNEGTEGPEAVFTSCYIGNKEELFQPPDEKKLSERKTSPNLLSQRSTENKDTGQGIRFSQPGGRGGEATGLSSETNVEKEGFSVKDLPPLDFTVPDALPTLRQAIRDLRPRDGDTEPDQASPDHAFPGQISPDQVPLDQDAPPRWKRFLNWLGKETAMRAGRHGIQ